MITKYKYSRTWFLEPEEIRDDEYDQKPGELTVNDRKKYTNTGFIIFYITQLTFSSKKRDRTYFHMNVIIMKSLFIVCVHYNKLNLTDSNLDNLSQKRINNVFPGPKMNSEFWINKAIL